MIRLKAEPANPAQFFGACGFFELASFLNPGISAYWAVGGMQIDADESIFWDVTKMITRFKIERDVSWDWRGNENAQTFDLLDETTQFRLRMDWWECRDGVTNSIWKCFAANMKASDTTEKMLAMFAANAHIAAPDTLFEMKEHASGRLGFDPRSAWDAGDAGFSPNEHASLKAVATYPAAELLASIAVETFPFRFKKKRGSYRAWKAPLPILLARSAAVNELPGVSTDPYVYERVMRGQGISSLGFGRLEQNLTLPRR